MKKRHITLFTAIAAAAALAPTAQAAITGTGGLPTLDHTGTTDWDITDWDWIKSDGTLVVDGGSELDATVLSTQARLGDSGGDDVGPGTITVTGAGSKLIMDNSFDIGQGGATGSGSGLIVAAGGFVSNTYISSAFITGNGNGSINPYIQVTGANSVLLALNGKFSMGQQSFGATMTGCRVLIGDGGLVQTKEMMLGLDGTGCEAYVHMSPGGILAVLGNKTSNPFVKGGMFNAGGGTPAVGIMYNPSGNGTTWVDMIGATLGVDYTLSYETSGATDINGQDVNGYTVLTVLVPPPAGTVFMIK
jgi:hypothetical protein